MSGHVLEGGGGGGGGMKGGIMVSQFSVWTSPLTLKGSMKWSVLVSAWTSTWSICFSVWTRMLRPKGDTGYLESGNVLREGWKVT